MPTIPSNEPANVAEGTARSPERCCLGRQVALTAQGPLLKFASLLHARDDWFFRVSLSTSLLVKGFAMATILIKGGRVIDPAEGVDRQADVLVEDGRVSRIDRGIAASAREIDAHGQWVVPGLIDIHVHLREPGQEHKETIASGTRSAAAGGFTRVCCMPNTDPVNDTRAVTEYILRRAKEDGVVHVHPIGAISKGLAGERLTEFADMKEAGIVAVSDDGRPLTDSGLMRRALEYARTFDLPVLQHCEDPALSRNGSTNEGAVSLKTGLSSQPPQAESILVGRDIELVELTGARYHALHMSTEASLRRIRDAKRRGLPVTCEVTPHHFSLTDESCSQYDTAAKVNPPLRSGSDVDAVKAALEDGTVDVIATDHAPHAQVDKEVEFELAAFGISGFETALALSLNLWREDLVAPSRLVALMTTNPARVLGLEGGTLASGALADLTVIDPDLEWTVDPQQFASLGKNTPFAGRQMRGRAKLTLVGGRVAHEYSS